MPLFSVQSTECTAFLSLHELTVADLFLHVIYVFVRVFVQNKTEEAMSKKGKLTLLQVLVHRSAKWEWRVRG